MINLRKLFVKSDHRKWIGLGYMIIMLLIYIIGYRWYNEWDEIERLEFQNKQINKYRNDINNIHIQFIEF